MQSLQLELCLLVGSGTNGKRAAALERLKAIRFIDGSGESYYMSYLTELEHAMTPWTAVPLVTVASWLCCACPVVAK